MLGRWLKQELLENVLPITSSKRDPYFEVFYNSMTIRKFVYGLNGAYKHEIEGVDYTYIYLNTKNYK